MRGFLFVAREGEGHGQRADTTAAQGRGYLRLKQVNNIRFKPAEHRVAGKNRERTHRDHVGQFQTRGDLAVDSPKRRIETRMRTVEGQTLAD